MPCTGTLVLSGSLGVWGGNAPYPHPGRGRCCFSRETGLRRPGLGPPLLGVTCWVAVACRGWADPLLLAALECQEWRCRRLWASASCSSDSLASICAEAWPAFFWCLLDPHGCSVVPSCLPCSCSQLRPTSLFNLGKHFTLVSETWGYSVPWASNSYSAAPAGSSPPPPRHLLAVVGITAGRSLLFSRMVLAWFGEGLPRPAQCSIPCTLQTVTFSL